MNFVGRVFNSMSDLYKDMNLSQLSGANDVIVVQTERGLCSTGFHAHFGNVHSFKTSREVIVTVNDRVLNVDTRLDREGNVFFSLHSSPSTEAAGSLGLRRAAGVQTVKMMIESETNYSHLLLHYEKVHDGIVHKRYAFSECLFKKVTEESIGETFNANKAQNFLGSDTVVVGVYMQERECPDFLLPFCLFSELFFCLEHFRESSEPDRARDRKRSTGQYLVKQLLRKRVQPKQMAMNEKLVYLPEQHLREMCLLPGPNRLVYRLSGTPIIITSTVYLWKDTEKVVVSDIDGTITKSDIIGYIYGAMGKDWTHEGIAELYNKIYDHGYQIVYLSSRPIGHIGLTKAYLERIEQNTHTLPQGPTLLFPGRLLSAIYREVILGPEEFKIAAISEIKQLLARGEIYAGFGNKESDRIAYEVCDVNPGRIFIVNPLGEILTGPSGIVKLTHRNLHEISDGIFPPVRRALDEAVSKHTARL
ncbi:phosphatidate phosphatase LPIN [Nematocida sp. AWRm77]|nr:phosphatidate phosphatase LPIN [Nematocida sp. AWRm77]